MRSVRLIGMAFAAGLVLSSTTAAQEVTPRLGVLGGATMSKFGGEDAEDFKTRVGFFGGAFAELGLSRNFAIQPEVLFVQKGAKLEESGVDATWKVNYLEVPVLLKVMFPPSNGGRVTPFLYAGPAVAFKATCKVTGSAGGVSLDIDCDEFDDEVKVKSTDFSAVGGLGVNVGDFVIGGRYTLGLARLVEAVDEEIDVKNRTISFYVGYSFRLTR